LISDTIAQCGRNASNSPHFHLFTAVESNHLNTTLPARPADHPKLRGDAFLPQVDVRNDAAGFALATEVCEIAERGPMPLFLANVHLYRARIVGMTNAEGRMTNWPEVDPKAELARARALIEKHGYWRRREELADAEAASVAW
jgi:hypothetical protein